MANEKKETFIDALADKVAENKGETLVKKLLRLNVEALVDPMADKLVKEKTETLDTLVKVKAETLAEVDAETKGETDQIKGRVSSRCYG